MKLKIKGSDKGTPPKSTKPKPKTAEAPAKTKPKTKKVKSGEDGEDADITYQVRIYGQQITRYGDKQGTVIIGRNGGVLCFEHRRPRSSKRVRRIEPMSRVIQYGQEGDSAWVFLNSRVLTDSFNAVGYTVEGNQINFDLGDGITTSVNVAADYEVSGYIE